MDLAKIQLIIQNRLNEYDNAQLEIGEQFIEDLSKDILRLFNSEIKDQAASILNFYVKLKQLPGFGLIAQEFKNDMGIEETQKGKSHEG